MNDIPESPVPIDLNKIIADFSAQLISSAAGSVLGKGKGLFKGISDEVRLKLQRTYSDYLLCAFNRFSMAKSFLIRDDATRLYDFYVPMGLESASKSSAEATISDFGNGNRLAVIRGGAGSGKSMMMKHLFLDAIMRKAKIPIFIELRRLNDFDGDLLAFLRFVLRENQFLLDDEFVAKALKDGHFAIFLDGFDEVSHGKRKEITKQILSVSSDFEKCIVIVSSRPDEEFGSWSHFTTWNISPLNLSQALRLIEKVPTQNIDEETRDKFLSDLSKGLFEKHQSFLSNPLLLSIMAITYANSGDVPQKISIFYENAYIALFERHDALKGAFKRDRLCSLDILEFKRIFAAFSTITFNNLISDARENVSGSSKSLRFPRTDALGFIEEASAMSDVNTSFTSADFLEDSIRAVCLLVEDGLEITFAHRSFQEYFTAIFISRLDDYETQRALILSYFAVRNNRVVELLWEIDPMVVEKALLIPYLEKTINAVSFSGKLEQKDYAKFLKYCFEAIRVMRGERGALDNHLLIIPKKGPGSDNENFLSAFVVAFILLNYLGLSGLGTLSTATIKSLKSLEKGASRHGITPVSHEDSKANRRVSLLDNPKALELVARDTRWGLSVDRVEEVLSLYQALIERHDRVDKARKTSLLLGLKSKKRG